MKRNEFRCADGKRKSRAFVDKLIERVGPLEPEEVQENLVRLVQAEGDFERVFEALQEGVIVTDEDGRIIYINSGGVPVLRADAGGRAGGAGGRADPGARLGGADRRRGSGRW